MGFEKIERVRHRNNKQEFFEHAKLISGLALVTGVRGSTEF